MLQGFCIYGLALLLLYTHKLSGMVWYSRGYFGDGALSSDVHLPFSNGGRAK